MVTCSDNEICELLTVLSKSFCYCTLLGIR